MRDSQSPRSLMLDLALQAACEPIVRSVRNRLSAPGAVIERCSSDERAILQQLTADDLQSVRHDTLRMMCDHRCTHGRQPGTICGQCKGVVPRFWGQLA